MNITIATAIAILFLMPGILFRRFYFSEEFSKEHFKGSLTETLFSCVGISGVLHLIWFGFSLLTPWQVDFEVIGQLLTMKDFSNIPFQNIQSHVFQIGLYHISIAVASMILGWQVRLIVRRKKLDRRYKLLRFKNSWHYLFKGEFTEFPRTSLRFSEDLSAIEVVQVDAITELNNNTQIYMGYLADYELTSDGGLEYILLTSTKRKLIQYGNGNPAPNEGMNELYTIPGHVVTLPYTTIKNLNLTYYKLILSEEDLTLRAVKLT